MVSREESEEGKEVRISFLQLTCDCSAPNSADESVIVLRVKGTPE
jgi:hypothetical protein